MHTHGTIAIEEGTSLAPSTTLVYDDDIETPSRVTIDMSPAPARTGSLLTVDNVEQALTRAQAEVDRLTAQRHKRRRRRRGGGVCGVCGRRVACGRWRSSQGNKVVNHGV